MAATTDYAIGGIFAALSSASTATPAESTAAGNGLASLFATPTTNNNASQLSTIVFSKKSGSKAATKADHGSDSEHELIDNIDTSAKKTKKKASKVKREKEAANNENTDNSTANDGKESSSLDETTTKLLTKEEELERTGRTVFVGNLSVNTSRKELKKLFKQHGPVETVRIRSVPTKDPKQPKKVALIKKQFHAERQTMNAYVVFKSKDSAEKSLASNGTEYEGFHIRVDMSGNDTQHDQKNSLFIGNLPFACKEDELRSHFEECGEIANVRLIRDKASGLGKGFGYVTFADHGSVVLGLKMNGTQLSERPLRVQKSSTSLNRGKPGTAGNPASGRKPGNTTNPVKKPGSQPAASAGVKRQQFSGARATSKKDVSKLKREFRGDGNPLRAGGGGAQQQQQYSANPNALRRLQNKAKKGIEQKKAKRKASIEKKLNKKKKTKN